MPWGNRNALKHSQFITRTDRSLRTATWKVNGFVPFDQNLNHTHHHSGCRLCWHFHGFIWKTFIWSGNIQMATYQNIQWPQIILAYSNIQPASRSFVRELKPWQNQDQEPDRKNLEGANGMTGFRIFTEFGWRLKNWDLSTEIAIRR